MKIVVITGSRRWANKRPIYEDLTDEAPDLVIHGHAKGADTWAECWAVENGVLSAPIAARWSIGFHGGPVRNRMMVVIATALHRNGHEVKVLAYPMGESKGTRGMMELCAIAGLEVEDRSENR